ncbi:hypothetical protein [Sphingomonas profundi]|uniref:hypothetical protein n=1 Tax=Alterirhizorhabdus profundi TaxID=2681549 RepID=UPI001E2FB2D3|nr:hypothetical protein [Sphingomonas profundi]
MDVALAALISACRTVEDPAADAGERLRATLPLAGATLVEHQARLAAAAGAGPIVILVERLPATLTAAVDRLRRDGLHVEIARGLTDAVDRIHPDETLLVMADGWVAGADLVARMAEVPVPALLAVPDDADHAGFERIDAAARWGGLLLIDGARLRHTASRLGEWDLESTLLRRAVQEGAARIDAYEEGDAPPVIADAVAMLDPLDRALARGGRGEAEDAAARFLFPPIVDALALPLLRRGIEPRWIGAAAGLLALAAAPLALFGWRWTALSLLLLSGPLAALAVRLAEIRLVAYDVRRLHVVRSIGAAVALLLLGGDLAATQGWGCWLLACAVPLGMAALSRERRILALVDERPAPLWLASLDGLIWIALPVAVAGPWLAMVAVVAAYALASFAVVQQRVAGRMAAARV